MNIITCPQWGARPPKEEIKLVAMAERIIIHHTAGHHRELEAPATESTEEAIRYARDIQNYHMDVNGWIDSGHNFLVCRNGDILQGRWFTVSTIQHSLMVQSAHCPGQNDQIGIEHEHKGTEPPTEAQLDASAWLIAWISTQYGLEQALPLEPHRKYFATACPANLEASIPTLRAHANKLLTGAA